MTTKPDPLLWKLSIQSLAIVKRDDGQKGGVSINGSGRKWIVLAFSAPGDSLDEMLEQHKHRLLGEFTTERKAKLAGEAFLAAWLTGTASVADVDCACHEAPRPRRRGLQATRARPRPRPLASDQAGRAAS